MFSDIRRAVGKTDSVEKGIELGALAEMRPVVMACAAGASAAKTSAAKAGRSRCYTVSQRGSGGIGRRASLRSWWPKGRRGSSPFFRTIYDFKTGTLSTCCFTSLAHGWGAFRIQFAVSHTA